MLRLVKEEEGVSLAEEGLLIALVAVACIAALVTLGGSLSTLFTGVAGRLTPPA